MDLEARRVGTKVLRAFAERATLTRSFKYNYQKNPYLRIKHLMNRWGRLITEGLCWSGQRKEIGNAS